ncbi:MAG: EAL domain-containing protein, partial [Pseudomonadota bacterium]
ALGLTALAALAAALLQRSGRERADRRAMAARLDDLSAAVETARSEMKAEADRLRGRIDDLERAADAAGVERSAELKLLRALAERLSKAPPEQQPSGFSSDVPSDAPRIGAAAPQPPALVDDTARKAILRTVQSAVEQSRVDLYLQPTVSLPQRKLRSYEAYTRLRDEEGAVLEPSVYLAAAEEAGLMPLIDNILLLRCTQLIRKFSLHKRAITLFCNLSPRTLKDAAFFDEFIAYLRQNRDLHGGFVFEMGQADLERLGLQDRERLKQLADLGFAFSMDKVTHLDLDLIELREQNFRFVKAPVDLLISALRVARHDDADKGRDEAEMVLLPDIHAEDFKELLNRYRIDLVAEKVETEADVIEVLEMQVDFGQGHLFGAPLPASEVALSRPAARSA